MRDLDTSVKEVVGTILRNLLPESTPFKVDIVKSTKNIIVQIDVVKEVRGICIGHKGQTVNSIKDILISLKNLNFQDDHRKIYVELLEEEVQDYTTKKRSNWDD